MSRLDNLTTWTGTGGNLKRSPLLSRIAAHDELGGGEDNRPGERIPVVREFGHRGPLELFEVVTSTRPISMDAAALAFMRAGPHDVRPWLLLAMFGQDERAIAACHAYGFRYLSASCKHERADVLDAAAADGLASLYGARRSERGAVRQHYARGREGRRHFRLVPPTDARAKSLGIRADRYRELRNRAQLVFKIRFMEACSRFYSGRPVIRDPLW
jgi:hypothetical protein